MVIESLKQIASQANIECDYDPPFNRGVKKIKDKALLRKVLGKIWEILENPYIGDKKRGIIKDVYSHKFYHVRTQYIISYKIISAKKNNIGIKFIMIEDHSDDYKGLERYVKTSTRL